jgi:hypothetical protein
MLVAVLALSATAFGQVVTTKSGYTVEGGPSVMRKQATSPLLMTPTVDLDSPTTGVVGARNATAGNQVGARNGSFDTQDDASTPQMSEGEVSDELPQADDVDATDSATAAADFMLPAADSESLAELAAHVRAEQRATTHVYTNADIRSLSSRNDVSVVPNKPTTISHDSNVSDLPADDRIGSSDGNDSTLPQADLPSRAQQPQQRSPFAPK